jgi:hypothetical protein
LGKKDMKLQTTILITNYMVRRFLIFYKIEESRNLKYGE